jgi:CheY-like chemotaxis protein
MSREKQIAEKKTVLFVDDDRAMLLSIERCFLDEPFKQLFAQSGQEALEILQKEEVHVIVTDMCMPEMTGLELLRIAKKEYPDITGLILTGYEPDTELQNAIEQGEIFWLIPKPLWTDERKFERLILQALIRSDFQKVSKSCQAIEK